jgi:hypothetical protein
MGLRDCIVQQRLKYAECGSRAAGLLARGPIESQGYRPVSRQTSLGNRVVPRPDYGLSNSTEEQTNFPDKQEETV